MMNDEATDATSLDSIGAEAVMDTALSALGFEVAGVTEPEGAGEWPTVTLDPGVDTEWAAALERMAASTAGGAFWRPDAPCTAELVLEMVRDELCESLAAATEDWRLAEIEGLAGALAEKYPALIGGASPYSAPIDLVAELEEKLGLYVDTADVDRALEGCRVRVSLVIGTAADFGGDWAPSRRVLRSAARWLDGAREEPWDPIADPSMREDYLSCSAQWLCGTQGTDLAAVVNGARGDFAESMRDAIVEDVGDSWGWPMVSVLTTMDLEGYAEANTAFAWEAGRGDGGAFARIPTGESALGVARQPHLALLDPVNGAGQCVDIELERPVDLPLENVFCAMRDGVGGRWGNWYTSMEVGGWLSSEFDRPLQEPSMGIDRALRQDARKHAGMRK